VIILDTNVLSEALKPSPAPEVLRWFAAQPALQLFTTAITQAEIVYGVELLPKGKRRAGLLAAVNAMFAADFGGRILPFDSDAARLFPQRSPRPAARWDARSRNSTRRSRPSRGPGRPRLRRGTPATFNTVASRW
jgi:hypothetical protein